MLLKYLAAISRSPCFPSPSTLEVPWYASFNVVSSTFSEDDYRYTSPLKRLSPKRTIAKLGENFNMIVVKKPSAFVPTDAHFVVIHGENEFYDDVWLKFTQNDTQIISASRVGIYDANVNRNRINRINDLFR